MIDELKEKVDFTVNRSNLFKEESFTDLKAGSIRRLIPVKPDGTVDKSRKTIFVGHTNIVTPYGSVPIQSIIQAKDLQQAIKKFPPAMEVAMEKLLEDAKKMQEEMQHQQTVIEKPDSRIIVPGR